MPPAIAVVGAIASVAGTVLSISAQKKAARAQRQQQANERRRSARQNIRQAQIARASVVAGAIGSGAAGGSGAIGGAGAIGSRLGEALGFASQQSALSGIISRQTERANFFSGVAGVGANLFNLGGGFGTLFPEHFGGADAQTRARVSGANVQ